MTGHSLFGNLRAMLLRDVIDASGLSQRDFALAVGCSPQHLLQAAQLKKSLGPRLALRIKAFAPKFSIEEQMAAFVRAHEGEETAA